MKDKELLRLGIPAGKALDLARDIAQRALEEGWTKKEIRKRLNIAVKHPARSLNHPLFGPLAEHMSTHARPAGPPVLRKGGRAPYRQWGERLDPKSIQQMENACSLPISIRGALMPDAHCGFGLPIGGVLATEGAVIPYAVGVDIACCMKLSVLDYPLDALENRVNTLKKAIEAETRFGVGASFAKERRSHSVMDHDWSVSPITKAEKDNAWSQLGSSGGGNHFVEFGELHILKSGLALAPGIYLALLSHSGSRHTGAAVCDHYSQVARKKHRELPHELQHLSWLDLDSHAGQEYWAAMSLMGEYAAANHACIHQHIAAHLGATVLMDIENHHNFAWREVHDGRNVIVHRKGATPASEGVLGIIPASMATPGYVVRGQGEETSLQSAAHGAGRVMSRTQAKKTLQWSEARALLEKQRVTLISAGLDEVPMVYKDIDAVMAAQSNLVEVLARFQPRLVKMAPPEKHH